ncbi:MAG: hypothetical protein NTY91_02345 [Euryarchaeota archaeon]|nr:hypothetical protein [Euryarchaeota archaeon]
MQYLSHIAAYTQNYYMGFTNIFFAVIAILVVIVGFPEFKVWEINKDLILTSKPILSIVVIVFIILIRGLPNRVNYGKEVLTGKTANRLLLDIFSNKHPELKNARGIKKKWDRLKEKIENINDGERKKLLKEKTKKAPDEQYFDNWFNDIP